MAKPATTYATPVKPRTIYSSVGSGTLGDLSITLGSLSVLLGYLGPTVGSIIKQPTTFTPASKPQTNFRATAKNATSYDPANGTGFGWLLNSTTVLLNSATNLLNGFTTTNLNTISNKPRTAYQAA